MERMVSRVSNSETKLRGRSRKKRSLSRKRLVLPAICLAIILMCSIGGTLAYIVTSTDPITNTFVSTKVEEEITEKFDNNIKSSIIVKNTGEAEVYIRVKLVSYRVKEDADGTITRIGGSADIDYFDLGEGWLEDPENGCYYYMYPVSVGEKTGNLIDTGNNDSGIVLEEYTDKDGGKQVVEVLAEAIQSKPADAVESVWPVTVASDGSLTVKSGTN